jgi:hypothetical protein
VNALQLVPLDFGEERGHMPALHLVQRIGFMTPLVVRFAVNESLRITWIQSLQLYPNR